MIIETTLRDVVGLALGMNLHYPPVGQCRTRLSVNCAAKAGHAGH